MNPDTAQALELSLALKDSYWAYGFLLEGESEGEEFFKRVLFAAIRLAGADGAALNWLDRRDEASDITMFREKAAAGRLGKYSGNIAVWEMEGERHLVFADPQSLKQLKISSTLSTPLRSRQRVYGVIHVYGLEENSQLAEHGVELLAIFCSTLAMVLENKKSQGLLSRENDALRLMAREHRDPVLENDPQKVLNSALERALSLADMDRGMAFLEKQGSGFFEALSSRGISKEALIQQAQDPLTRFNAAPLLRLVQQGGLRVGDLSTCPGLNICFPDSLPAFACLPLLEGGQLLGMIFLASGKPKSEDTFELLQTVGPLLADQAAQSISNFNLLNSLHQKSRDLEAASASLLHAERLAIVGQLAASVAHQIRNPLSVISANTELMISELEDGHRHKEVLMLLHRKVQEANSTIQELMEISRPVSLEMKLCPVGESLKTIEKFITSKCRSQNVALNLELEPNLPELWLDQTQFQRCLLDLSLNALQEMPQGGELHLGATRRGDFVDLRVIDSGKGIKEKDLPHIFEPFFAAKRTGSGLGLFNVRRICNEMGIEAAASNAAEGGAVFTLQIKVSAESPAPIIPKPLSAR